MINILTKTNTVLISLLVCFLLYNNFIRISTYQSKIGIIRN